MSDRNLFNEIRFWPLSVTESPLRLQALIIYLKMGLRQLWVSMFAPPFFFWAVFLGLEERVYMCTACRLICRIFNPLPSFPINTFKFSLFTYYRRHWWGTKQLIYFPAKSILAVFFEKKGAKNALMSLKLINPWCFPHRNWCWVDGGGAAWPATPAPPSSGGI